MCVESYFTGLTNVTKSLISRWPGLLTVEIATETRTLRRTHIATHSHKLLKALKFEYLEAEGTWTLNKFQCSNKSSEFKPSGNLKLLQCLFT